MKKIGIVTHYYNTRNFGGILQAYALCYYLNQHKVEAEQICYDKINSRAGSKTYSTKKFKEVFSHPLKNRRRIARRIIILLNLIFRKNRQKKIADNIEKQIKNFDDFSRNEVPHSSIVYTSDNIEQSLDKYDMFICGSDQVWNGYDYVWSLDFVKDKKKIAYAASISRSYLDEDLKKKFKEFLKGYDAISLREENDTHLIDALTDIPIESVIDPVFLLNRKQWDEVAKASNIVNKDKYIFCYFLGENKREREIAKKLSRELQYRLILIPMLDGGLSPIDRIKGAIVMEDATPNDFVKLIRDAEIVLTDSFHAVAFSLIFHKEFFAFNRDLENSMSSRLTNITIMSKTEKRFCCEKKQQNIAYILNSNPIDYTISDDALKDKIDDSIKFLERNVLNDE